MNELYELREKVTKVLGSLEPDDKRVRELLDTLEKIDDQLRKEKKFSLQHPSRLGGIDPNVLLNSVTNLLGILCVLNFERAGVITSRAFSMIKKN